MTVTLAIGELRQVVTLSNPSVTSPDGDGGYVQTFTPLDPATWRCAIERASVQKAERFFGGSVLAQSSYILTGRFHPGITMRTQMVWVDRAGVTHNATVLDLVDTEGAGVELKALVSEIVT